MCAPWDASAPIEDLFQQINVAAEFGVYARHPIAANDLVQAGELLILKTGTFGQAYKYWRALPENERTWDYFQEYWQEQYDLAAETVTTAGSLGCRNAVAETDADSYSDTVANFGTAFAANSTAFSNLTETNRDMATSIDNFQAQLNSLTTQLQNIAAAGVQQQQ